VLKLASRAALPLLALALALWCLAPAALAATPSENIPLGAEPSSCATEASAECEHWVIERLDGARADLHLGAYVLPADFTALSPDKQLLILTDLDRVAYRYTPVIGLNTSLSEAAQAGVREARDPMPLSAEGPWRGFGSDWASTGALIGYYLWMYDDGYPGPNRDCTSPGASGCWGHRKVILGEAVELPQPQLMGAAAGSAVRNGGAALIISSNGGTNAYYTWAQAQREGAGAGVEEPPPVKQENPPAEEPQPPTTSPSTEPAPSPQAGGQTPGGSGTAPSSAVLATATARAARVAGLLGSHLSPSGRAARVRAILRRGGITLTLPPGLRGALVVDYYLGSTRRALLARGSRLLDGSAQVVAVKLTAAGRYVLEHQASVAVAAHARFVPATGAAVSVSRPLVLTR